MMSLLTTLAAKVWLPLAAAGLVWAPLAYILSVQRVLEQWDAGAPSRSAVRVELAIVDGDPTWPARLVVDVHPELGMRVDAGEAGRFVLRRDEVVAADRAERPVWLPQLEVLVLRDRAALQAWLGFDLSRNRLARCGLDDCFVLGGAAALPEVWLDKDRFELRRYATAGGQIVEYAELRDYGQARFPREIRILSSDRRLASLSLLELRPAPRLVAEDFSAAWVRQPRS